MPFEIGQRVTVPGIRGTFTKLVSSGTIEDIQTTRNGGKIVYVKLQYGKLIKVLPFKEDELNTKKRIYR